MAAQALSSISSVYTDQILAGDHKSIMQLELSQYLEKNLWPAYHGPDEAILKSKPLLLSIIAMVNEKFRERATVWETFQATPTYFDRFFLEVTRLALDATLSIRESTAILIFLMHSFNSVEIELVRKEIQKYISMPIWICLSARRLEREFAAVPKLKKFWRKLEKADEKLSEERKSLVAFERHFLADLIKSRFFAILASISGPGNYRKSHRDAIAYCERFLEFLIDIEALLPTRRFFNALIDDLHVLTVARLSPLHARSEKEGKLFSQLLENLRFYVKFEIDDVSGEALTESSIASRHFEKMTALQKVAYKHFTDEGEFRDLYLASVSSIDSRPKLLKYLKAISEEKLTLLCAKLGIGLDDEAVVGEICKRIPGIDKKEVLLEILVDFYGRKDSQLKELNSLPLYPSEEVIWDENLVPSQYYFGDGVLALPKLNIQFLTLHDYLLRNFHLFRLESTYEIRQDIEQAVAHLKPWQTEDGGTMFGGWARMAIGIDSFAVTEIGKPKIGEAKPAKVKAEVVVNLNVKRSIKNEWEALRRHDVVFLVAVRPEAKPGTAYNYKEPFIPQVGLAYVRGAEVEGLLDPAGRLVDDNPFTTDRPHFDTDFRTYRLLLDTNQYKLDLVSGQVEKMLPGSISATEEIYDSFNILVRRKSKANNFKAVLETIRDLMNTKCVVPDWLHDVILGYGDPSAANYTQMGVNRELFGELDFFDTFLDLEHVQEAFPGFEVKAIGEASPVPPFKLKIEEEGKTVQVIPYRVLNRGPYKVDEPKRNAIRFTATQVEAIRSGVQHGLTMVVGPPGTGKTDLAVQIISTLYHNHPDQRTLIVTHSNQALNSIFEKIMQLDIDERHLLRLGHGEEQLETEKDFTRYGRVNYVLAKRLELLDKVAKLAQTLELSTDVAYTCETAGYFYLYHVLSKWEAFLLAINTQTSDEPSKDPNIVSASFPFTSFFADSGRDPLFDGPTFEANFEIAKGCFRYIKKIFTQLDEFRAFEMLRPGPDRANYLLVREAKIIAMTCTHAALKRSELVQMAFQYDNILMEESGQILEIETFIPLLLQNPEFGHNRLKRWIMIGDHLQLPPVIKNMSFQKFSNMEQSLFTRFVRLGVPTITLDAQGRSRGSLASLWSWRYKGLGNLAHVEKMSEFVKPNAGFVYDYQLIDVGDFNGVGESEPLPYFYQNLAEAEFVVATYMYMRILGYPAERITILTTYNGQKHLLRDVIEQRCASNPFIGRPAKVTTVDKFQGQQNDYILLSMVRSKTVGHVRDVRRLTVAMSRARLGLYVFARKSLFSGCYELAKTFEMLNRRPNELKLAPEERYGAEQLPDREKLPENVVKSVASMQEMVAFVFELYQSVMAKMQAERPEEFRRIMTGGVEEKMEDMQEEIKDEGEEVVQDEEMLFEPIGENDQALDDEVEMDSEEEVEKSKIPEDIET